MGYPMTYPRVVIRNGLTGSYAGTPGDAEAQWKRMIAGDLRRLEQDVQDDRHIIKFMEASGATEHAVRGVLRAFFTDFDAMWNSLEWLAADPHGRDSQLDELLATVYTPEGVKLWLAHAEKQGWSTDERLTRARQLADGHFA